MPRKKGERDEKYTHRVYVTSVEGKLRKEKFKWREEGGWWILLWEMIHNTHWTKWIKTPTHNPLLHGCATLSTPNITRNLKGIQEKKRKMKKARTRGLNTSMEATSSFFASTKAFLSLCCSMIKNIHSRWKQQPHLCGTSDNGNFSFFTWAFMEILLPRQKILKFQCLTFLETSV